MYRERGGGGGGGGSRLEMGNVDRKRINDALDKHLERSSPSTSRAFNGKDKLSIFPGGKPPADHRDSHSASLAENKRSDGYSLPPLCKYIHKHTHVYICICGYIFVWVTMLSVSDDL